MSRHRNKPRLRLRPASSLIQQSLPAVDAFATAAVGVCVGEELLPPFFDVRARAGAGDDICFEIAPASVGVGVLVWWLRGVGLWSGGGGGAHWGQMDKRDGWWVVRGGKSRARGIFPKSSMDGSHTDQCT